MGSIDNRLEDIIQFCTESSILQRYLVWWTSVDVSHSWIPFESTKGGLANALWSLELVWNHGSQILFQACWSPLVFCQSVLYTLHNVVDDSTRYLHRLVLLQLKETLSNVFYNIWFWPNFFLRFKFSSCWILAIMVLSPSPSIISTGVPEAENS